MSTGYTSHLAWEWGLILYSSSLVGEGEAPSCSAVCPHAAVGSHTPSDTLPVPDNENSDYFLKKSRLSLKLSTVQFKVLC
jgi:hypothetical protein